MVAGLAGSVALVTGGGGGLGMALCRMRGAEGATVVVADVRGEQAERTAAVVREAGGEAFPLHLDVTDERSAEEAVRRVLNRTGRLDVLVNNAGIDVTLPIDELTVADWDRIVGVNLRGPFVLSRAVFPQMKRQGGGQIVNIVSTAAKRAWANASAYHASKWGLLGLSHALHVEGRAVGIRVTAVIAGGMRTPFLFDRFPDLDPGLLQDPANVANTVRFVLSQPAGTVVPEVTVLPLRETSWP
ncbi:MAG: SDR family oxidoreductase [Chloroflexota bacterium]|nr:SDR family oxidoreductase [Chloroflexota bacterium]